MEEEVEVVEEEVEVVEEEEEVVVELNNCMSLKARTLFL